jgi:predicted RNA-binding Zn-ribbon protein involved in translation (DUF1610 family)
MGGQTDRTPAKRVVAERQQAAEPVHLFCVRCNFEVPDTARGCRNPCPNCGMLYSLGDCSD